MDSKAIKEEEDREEVCHRVAYARSILGRSSARNRSLVLDAHRGQGSRLRSVDVRSGLRAAGRDARGALRVERPRGKPLDARTLRPRRLVFCLMLSQGD